MRIPLLALVLLGCSDSVDPVDPPDEVDPVAGIALEEVLRGLQRPVDLTSPPGDPRIFVVEQPGRILMLKPGASEPEVFLDIRGKVQSGSEQGLLGLAFHPEHATNGHLYVNYTDLSGDTRVERYSLLPANPDRADSTSAKLIIAYDQPYSNHNGGQLLFDATGMLLIPTGDGGSGGDPQGRAQNRSSLLGKILRLDVDGGDPYAIPSDNPYAGRTDVRPEIWALGTRNPWRVSRDGNTLYVADVGQGSYEEISVVPADEAGLNFGWNRMEGSHCFSPESGCDRDGLTMPVIEYGRPQGSCVTGGYVYRGQAIPSLRGRYVYADYGNDWIRSFRYENGRATDDAELDVPSVARISSFGVDGLGELYVVTLGGVVYRFVPSS